MAGSYRCRYFQRSEHQGWRRRGWDFQKWESPEEIRCLLPLRGCTAHIIPKTEEMGLSLDIHGLEKSSHKQV